MLRVSFNCETFFIDSTSLISYYAHGPVSAQPENLHGDVLHGGGLDNRNHVRLVQKVAASWIPFVGVVFESKAGPSLDLGLAVFVKQF